MNNKIDWKLTAIFLGLFLGSFMGTFVYNHTISSDMNKRVELLETEMKIVAHVSLFNITELEKQKKEIALPGLDLSNEWKLDIPNTYGFDPNRVLWNLNKNNFNLE